MDRSIGVGSMGDASWKLDMVKLGTWFSLSWRVPSLSKIESFCLSNWLSTFLNSETY